jgi:hypothetical protein
LITKDRLDTISKENKRLTEKMEEIMTHPPRFLDNHHESPKKSLNTELRRREQKKIEQENTVCPRNC